MSAESFIVLQVPQSELILARIVAQISSGLVFATTEPSIRRCWRSIGRLGVFDATVIHFSRVLPMAGQRPPYRRDSGNSAVGTRCTVGKRARLLVLVNKLSNGQHVWPNAAAICEHFCGHLVLLPELLIGVEVIETLFHSE